MWTIVCGKLIDLIDLAFGDGIYHLQSSRDGSRRFSSSYLETRRRGHITMATIVETSCFAWGKSGENLPDSPMFHEKYIWFPIDV